MSSALCGILAVPVIACPALLPCLFVSFFQTHEAEKQPWKYRTYRNNLLLIKGIRNILLGHSLQHKTYLTQGVSMKNEASLMRGVLLVSSPQGSTVADKPYLLKLWLLRDTDSIKDLMHYA